MTAAKNVVSRHRGVERGVKALDNVWRRADLRHLTRGASARLVNLYSSYVCVRFCFVLPFVTAVSSSFFLRFGACSCFIFAGQLTPRDGSPCVCVPHLFL